MPKKISIDEALVVEDLYGEEEYGCSVCYNKHNIQMMLQPMYDDVGLPPDYSVVEIVGMKCPRCNTEYA